MLKGVALATVLCLLCSRLAAATEFVDGDDEPVTVVNGMHACPSGFVVTGVMLTAICYSVPDTSVPS